MRHQIIQPLVDEFIYLWLFVNNLYVEAVRQSGIHLTELPEEQHLEFTLKSSRPLCKDRLSKYVCSTVLLKITVSYLDTKRESVCFVHSNCFRSNAWAKAVDENVFTHSFSQYT
jgi:hypothetical protein